MSSRHLRYTLAGLVVVGGSALGIFNSLHAQQERGRSFRESGVVPTRQSERTVKLSYFGSTWDRVLRDVAKQMNRQLVMDKFPSGRITRRGSDRFTNEEAVRALNHELQKRSYRLLLQKEHLVLIDLDAARGRYARPVPNDSRRQPASTDFAAKSEPRTVRTADHQPARSPRIQQVLAQEDWSVEAQEQPEPIVEKLVPIRRGQAPEIARSIHEVFKARSRLNRVGLRGLPSFTVYQRDQDGRRTRDQHFEIAIDRENNTLVVSGPQKAAERIAKVIRDLDAGPRNKDEQIRLVPANRLKARTTEELQAELNRLRKNVRTSFRPDNAIFGGQDEVPAAPQPGQGDQQGQTVRRGMNLQGDVILQPLEDLGAVVIKGNQADIETVVRIIDELEKLSVGTLPEVTLVRLTSVNSEALAELLSSVYERLAELRERGTSERSGKVAFIPVVQPNAVMVLAPSVDMESILELVNQLDQKVDPESEFEIFPLKYAVATQVLQNLDSLFEEPTGLGSRMKAIADVRTNSLIVQARASDMEKIAAIIKKIDNNGSGSVVQVRIMPLNHAKSEELAETITEALDEIINPPSGTGGNFGGTGAQELRDSRSVVLEYLTREGDIERLLRSGLLADIRVKQDVRTNSLIVTAPEASMELIITLIAALDKAPASVADIKVFELKNADSTQAVELLEALFEDQNNDGELGVAIGGAEDAKSSLVPLRFSADVRTNTVVAAGSIEALSVVEAILTRLDEADSTDRQTTVIKLRNAIAQEVSDALNNYLQSRSQIQQSTADLISNVQRLQSEIIVEPEARTNSLIISATPKYFEEMRAVIERLDAAPPQVIIQALIVEVELDNNDEFGVELGFQDPLLFSRSILENIETLTTTEQNQTGGQVQTQTIVSSTSNPGFLFNNTLNPLGNNTGVNSNPTQIGTQGLSNFSLGRQNSDLGFGGFVFSASSDAVNVLIRALAARRSVHVLSRPQIRTLDNAEATIQVGQEVPVTTGITITNNASTPTVERQPAGILLTVLPTISPDGNIVMNVEAEKSAFLSGGVPVFVDGTTGNVVNAPIKDITFARSRVSVPNGQTIVLGGMITKTDETLERKVPWLGDLPLVGSAFRYDGTSTNRRELLIFLTPRVIATDADSELIKQIEAERIHFIESEAEGVHGPLFSVPGGNNAVGTGAPVNGFETYDGPALPGTDPAPVAPDSGIETMSGEKTKADKRRWLRPATWLKRKSG